MESRSLLVIILQNFVFLLVHISIVKNALFVVCIVCHVTVIFVKTAVNFIAWLLEYVLYYDCHCLPYQC